MVLTLQKKCSVLRKIQCKGSKGGASNLLGPGRAFCKGRPGPGNPGKPPAVTYATSTPVRLRRQFFLNHNPKYFVLCRYGWLGRPRESSRERRAGDCCTRWFLGLGACAAVRSRTEKR